MIMTVLLILASSILTPVLLKWLYSKTSKTPNPPPSDNEGMTGNELLVEGANTAPAAPAVSTPEQQT